MVVVRSISMWSESSGKGGNSLLSRCISLLLVSREKSTKGERG